jgi:hypothetical protein
MGVYSAVCRLGGSKDVRPPRKVRSNAGCTFRASVFDGPGKRPIGLKVESPRE